MNSKSNGLKDKLGKIHSFIHKFGKYFIIACLILFCVLCIKNKDQFAERVAKGVPESGMEKIAIADGIRLSRNLKLILLRQKELTSVWGETMEMQDREALI